MKYTKIVDNSVYYITEDNEKWKEISDIGKEDIMKLLRKFIEDEEFCLEEYNDESIRNEVHNIIYKSIYEKFQELTLNRKKLDDDSNNRYRQAINDYS